MGVAKEGGDTASARKCTFMELALCLAPGLDVNGISILYKAAKPALQVTPSLEGMLACWHAVLTNPPELLSAPACTRCQCMLL